MNLKRIFSKFWSNRLKYKILMNNKICSIPHHKKDILFFCREIECLANNRLACSQCIKEYHKTHDFEDLSDFIK